MPKTEKTKCPKCRKKVNAEIKAEGELICPICSKSLGFVFSPEKNLFLEMVQVYLDYKKIHAIATINEDGLLDIGINCDTQNHQQLADLLAKCMPISYVITNTASIQKDRRAGKRTKSRTKSGKWRKKNPNNLERFL